MIEGVCERGRGVVEGGKWKEAMGLVLAHSTPIGRLGGVQWSTQHNDDNKLSRYHNECTMQCRPVLYKAHLVIDLIVQKKYCEEENMAMRMQVPTIFIHYHHRVLKMAIAQKPTRTSGHH